MGLALLLAGMPVLAAEGAGSEAAALRERANTLADDGQCGEAEPLYRQAIALLEVAPGAQHPDTAGALSSLAYCLDERGEHVEAEALARRALAIREQALGPGDPAVAASLNRIGSALAAQGRQAEAEDFHRRALAIREQASPGDDVARIESMFALATTLDVLKRHAEAEALYRQVMQLEDATLEADDPERAVTREALAANLHQQQRWEEVPAYLQQALAIHERQAPLTLDAARAAIRLGAAQQLAGGMDEARVAYRRALEIAEQVLAPDDPELTRYIDQLSDALPAEDAEPLLRRSVALFAAGQGAAHPDTLITRLDLARNLRGQGKLREAEQEVRDVLAIARKTYGDRGAPTLMAQFMLGIVLHAQGRYLEAELVNREVLAVREATLGAAHFETGESLVGLADALAAQGRRNDAAGLYERALAVFEALVPTGMMTGLSLMEVAAARERTGDLGDAEQKLRRARAIFEERRGPVHELTATTTTLLAANLARQQRGDDAEALFRQAIELHARAGGTGDFWTADSLAAYAEFLDAQGRHGQAETQNRRAVAMRREVLGATHPDTVLGLARLASSVDAQGRAAEAELLMREAVLAAHEVRLRGSAPGGLLSDAGDGLRDPMQEVFRRHLPIAWNAAAARASDEARAQAFVSAQELGLSAAAQALAQAAARGDDRACPDAGQPCLSQLARERQDLVARLRAADERLLTALSAGDHEQSQYARQLMATLGTQLSATEQKLRAAFPDYAELVTPRALAVAQAQLRLQDGEGLLLLVPAGEDVFVFALGQRSIAWHRLAQGEAELTRRVQRLRCQVDAVACGDAGGAAAAQGGPAFERGVAFSLYRDLVAPVESALTGVDRLYVVSSGTLSGLPLGLLVTAAPQAGEDDGDPAVLARTAWLADRYALTTLPAVSSLRARAQAPAEAGRGFLGFGDPVLGDATAAATTAAATSARGGSGPVETTRYFRSVDGQGLALADPATLRSQLAPLPGTRDELLAMAQALDADASSLRLGNQATEAAVRASGALAQAGIVAFATHGLLPHEISGMDEPGLVFTPPAQANAADDGVLTASEAAQLSLQADWLILSACNTAGADGRAGADSLSGLARAFLYAGARSLLVSHWRVRDDVTSVLTVETLRLGRTQPQLTHAQALQQAMRGVRTGRRPDGSAVPGWTPDWAHPLAWAPFVVVSDQDR